LDLKLCVIRATNDRFDKDLIKMFDRLTNFTDFNRLEVFRGVKKLNKRLVVRFRDE